MYIKGSRYKGKGQSSCPNKYPREIPFLIGTTTQISRRVDKCWADNKKFAHCCVSFALTHSHSSSLSFPLCYAMLHSRPWLSNITVNPLHSIIQHNMGIYLPSWAFTSNTFRQCPKHILVCRWDEGGFRELVPWFIHSFRVYFIYGRISHSFKLDERMGKWDGDDLSDMR